MKITKPALVLVGLLLLTAVSACDKKPETAPVQKTEPASAEPKPAAEKAGPMLDGWKKFSSTQGSFSVLLPNDPKESDQQFGKLAMHGFAAQKNPQSGFGVSYCDFPKTADAKKVYDEVQTITVGKEAKLVSQKDLTFENYPAREFEFNRGGKANYTAHTLMIMVGQRLYTLAVISLTADQHPDERDAFFNSFSVSKN
ncbi:MAG TPA: hypothetical protein VGO57_09305 [Verrucomicrobiae bacterium]|jgi:hypothetical protein